MLCLITLLSNTAFADDPIKITISNTFDDVIFDGEWSFKEEWKASSLNEFRFDDDDLVLRTAHQDDYMYVLIDVLGDMTNDRMADRAVVCFDGKETSKMADESDWCYVATRGSKNGHTLNGGSPVHQSSHFNLSDSRAASVPRSFLVDQKGCSTMLQRLTLPGTLNAPSAQV